MKREGFTPKEGQVYTNNGGGEYRCIYIGSGFGIGPGIAEMQNIKSGWTLIAHGCGIYEDGTIDWDYSTGGRFEAIKERRHA